jgi:hypothetical protein
MSPGWKSTYPVVYVSLIFRPKQVSSTGPRRLRTSSTSPKLHSGSTNRKSSVALPGSALSLVPICVLPEVARGVLALVEIRWQTG